MNNKNLIMSLVAILFIVSTTHGFYKQTKVTLDTSNALTQDIGVVNKQIAQTTTIPTSGKRIIEITPVVGTYYNQPVKLLFYGIEFKKAADTTQPLNIQAAAKTMFADSKIKNNAQSLVAIYRQLPGEDQWTSLAEIPTVDTVTDLAAEDAIKLTINGRADVIALLPAYQAAMQDRSFGNKVGAQQIKIDTQKGAPRIFVAPNPDVNSASNDTTTASETIQGDT